MDFSREFGLSANIVEKDYVLGWLLAGISNHGELSQSWVFKGGTCLKKCYFETYRFSEDLDFTLTNADHLKEEFLVHAFQSIGDWVYETTGIEISKDTIRFEVFTNSRGGISAEGRIGYRGPMQRGGDPARVKLDLTSQEVLVLDPVIRDVHHPYSDRPGQGMRAKCYSFEEVFAEKIRALAERLRPRDLYDVVHLYRHDELRPDRAIVLSTLEKKCEFKGIAVPTFELIEGKPERVELEAEWENMLGHQLHELPPFQQFWQELPDVFKWLHSVVEKPMRAVMPSLGRSINEAWRPPAMAQAWHTSTPLEIIRFAAANRLCVDLDYIDEQGNRGKRLIEPYSLRQTQEGNLLLYAVKHQTGEDRSYRVDRTQGAQVTKQSFVPRYAVELTPSGPISAPPTARRSSGFSTPEIRHSRTSRRSSGGGFSGFGPTYVIECTYCGKRFNRKQNTTRLNPHKDKSGYPCHGRTGYMVDMKY
jgi:predicted nucleotidyltransferase component of viral defense system